MTDPSALRARLIELRRAALQRLAEALPVVDTGLMRVVTDAGAVLAAINEQKEPENG
jgi:hypothetical protein